MKLLILLTIAACFQASGKGYSQTISLYLKDASLETAFNEIKKQSAYTFVFTRDQLKNTQPVTIAVEDASIKEVLEICFKAQPLSFVLEGNYVVVQTKLAITPMLVENIIITGKIFNEEGEALAGVSITSKKNGSLAISSDIGEFRLTHVAENDILIITSIGYNKAEIPVGNKTQFIITLKVAVGNLDEAVIMAYGSTSKRLNSGNISKINGTEISRQPISNPLNALHGRVPGLIITQTNGLPGAAVQIQLRGLNSLTQGSSPLFVIDGIPFAPGNGSINQLGSILTAQNGLGLGPFNSINPSDIESIEVLKDADATSIYGSRGANGVVLITTKKGKAGKTKFTGELNSGFSKAARMIEMLDTKEYLQVRREAFANDGLTPNGIPGTPGFAPDLFLWDTTRYTDWQKLFWGGTAYIQSFNLSLSGGTQQTQFLIGGAYHRESNIFPEDLSYKRGSMNISIDHATQDKRLVIAFRNNYSRDKNQLISVSGPQFLNHAPNAPPLFDPSGNLVWSENGVTVDNPYAALMKRYTAANENLISNLTVKYKIIKGFTLNANFGYNSYSVNEKTVEPIASQNPNLNPTGRLSLGTSEFNSWIIEPHAEYFLHFGKTKLTFLLGNSWQEQTKNSHFVLAEGYTTDDLIESLSAGTITYKGNENTDYRYHAVFGRINYNIKDRYIINLSGRRDGSSRFGPGRQFANFGSIGSSWIFSKEKIVQKFIPSLSFGKLRISYGITGNDQIGDYQYLDSWSPTYGSNLTYQGTPGLSPQRLFNEVYSWELNRKLEGGIDLGFFKDRILLSAAIYRNRSDNQLIGYRLPAQTGFQNINMNFPALIQNSGIEFEINTRNIESKNLTWSSHFNISVLRNKLVSFPNIETSSYASTFVIGAPLSLIYKFRSKGVDPATGVFYFDDVNGDGSIKSGFNQDYVVTGHTSPKFFGGFINTINYKGFELYLMMEFRNQTGRHYMASTYGQSAYMPGMMYNQSKLVLQRWQKPGDEKIVQRYTTISATAAYQSALTLISSNGIYGDASYIRLKTVSLTYMLPELWTKSLKIQSCQLSIRGQNILTLTKYQGTDPESQNLFSVPLLRTWVANIRISF